MAGQNQFYPHATGAGANVLTSASWQALTARQSGFSAGLAKSIEFNTGLRQGTVVASMIGAFIEAKGFDALDNGDLAGLLQNFQAALRAAFSDALPASPAFWHFGQDTSISANSVTANVAPDIAGYTTGNAYSLIVNNTAVAGGTAANLDGRGNRNIRRRDGSPIQAGDWIAGQVIILLDDGNNLQLVNPNMQAITASTAYWHFGLDTSNNAGSITADVTPDITSYTTGNAYSILTANTATSGAVANLDGRGARNIKRRDGSPIQPGDWVTGQIITLIDDGVNLQLLSRNADAPAATTIWHKGTASGATNAVTVTDLSPAISGYADGVPLLLTFPGGIANDATIQIGSLAAVPLQRNDGSVIRSTDLAPGSVGLFAVSGTAAVRFIGLANGQVPIIQTTNPVLYVDPGGSDANDGTVNRPFQTIASALAYGTSRFSLAAGSLTIQLKTPGTTPYAMPGVLPATVGTVVIQGDAGNQAGYIVSGSGPSGGSVGGITGVSGAVRLSGVTLRNTGTINSTLHAGGPVNFSLDHVTFASDSAGIFPHIFSGAGGYIGIGPGCIANSSMANLFSASNGGTILLVSNFALQNNPNFSDATVAASGPASVTIAPSGSITGAATGRRYRSSENALIRVFGAGPNAISGDQAGITQNGGLYV